MENITLDDLAGMIQDQFSEVNRQFSEVNMQFSEVNKRFDKLENGQKELFHGQEEIILKLSNVAYRFELKELEGKVSFLEKEVAQLKARLK